MKTLKHIIKGQFESIEELITVSLDHWTALYFKLGKVRASLHITADIKRRNHLGESYAYEFVNIVLRRIVLQHELGEVLAQKENFFNTDPDDPDYDSDYDNLERLDDREIEIVDELEKLEGADQPEYDYSDDVSLENNNGKGYWVIDRDYNIYKSGLSLTDATEYLKRDIDNLAVAPEDPATTGNQTATVETLDENGEWGNKVTLTEGQYQHEKKCQAEDEERHNAPHSPDDSYWDDDDSDPWD